MQKNTAEFDCKQTATDSFMTRQNNAHQKVILENSCYTDQIRSLKQKL